MARVYTDSDASLEPLKNKTIAVIGYGIQGRAQAMNLRDSGLRVVVGLRKGGKSWDLAVSERFEVYEVEEAVKRADVVLVLIPDMEQPKVWERQIGPFLKEGAVVDFAHGFNIHYGLIKPPRHVDVVMVAPKAPGGCTPRLQRLCVEVRPRPRKGHRRHARRCYRDYVCRGDGDGFNRRTDCVGGWPHGTYKEGV
jgi:ketol-acid reductoisomerase